MKRTIWMMAVAVLAAGSMAYAADGTPDGLDAALGAEKPAIDPGTASKNDNKDLINDLTTGKRIQPTAPDAGKMIGDIMTHTKDAADNLKLNLDAGADTQDHQRKALAAMDTLIELVRQQEQKKQQGQGKPDPGQKKEKNPGQGPPQPGDHQEGGTEAAQESQLPGGSANPFRSNGDIISKDPKEWGNLPPKDRDEILNSLQNGALKDYQTKIRKYYEALAEIGRSK
jgi:hypothetical protein